MIRRPSLKKLKQFALDNFFTDYKEKLIWQPFEDYSVEQVEEMAEDMYYCLGRLLGYKPMEI